MQFFPFKFFSSIESIRILSKLDLHKIFYSLGDKGGGWRKYTKFVRYTNILQFYNIYKSLWPYEHIVQASPRSWKGPGKWRPWITHWMADLDNEIQLLSQL